MVDIELIRKDPQGTARMLARRGLKTSLLDEFMRIDEQWRKTVSELQELRHTQKDLGARKDIDAAKRTKEQIQEMQKALEELEHARHALLLEFPNFPFADVPEGKDASDNKISKTVGKIPSFPFTPKDHLDLGEALGIIDVKQAARVAGARFSYLKGAGALMEFALIQYAANMLTAEGFEAVIPPVMIRSDVYEGMGRLSESQKEERYYLSKDDLYLAGSAEHTLGPLYMDTVFTEGELPKRMVGFSTCFRREAGSYGKDMRGILRVHQFDKVEMFSFSLPEKSEEEHRYLLSLQEKLFGGLDVPYRVVEICTGDLGSTDARQFDIEAWIPSQRLWREVASCSNTTTYQTRGINTKVRRTGGLTEHVHALNATALAIGRTIIAILENNQQKDGSVIVPRKLRKYTGFKKIG